MGVNSVILAARLSFYYSHREWRVVRAAFRHGRVQSRRATPPESTPIRAAWLAHERPAVLCWPRHSPAGGSFAEAQLLTALWEVIAVVYLFFFVFIGSRNF